jgi:hypothetical protein
MKILESSRRSWRNERHAMARKFKPLWCLNNGFIHKTINHSKNFIDPITGAETQTIESHWRHVKNGYNIKHGERLTYYHPNFKKNGGARYKTKLKTYLNHFSERSEIRKHNYTVVKIFSVDSILKHQTCGRQHLLDEYQIILLFL